MDAPELEVFTEETLQYLEKHRVYAMFERIMRKLTIDRPDDVLGYIKNCLAHPDAPAVIVLGASGQGRSKLSSELAKELGVPLVTLAKDLPEEQCGKGKLAADDVVLDAFNKRIAELKDTSKGYVLDGFPRTRTQALALVRARIVPDRVLVIDNTDERTLSNFRDATGSEEAATKALQLLKRHQRGTLELFNSALMVLDGAGAALPAENPDSLLAQALRRTSARDAAVPVRALRTFVCGAPGSGRTTVAKMVAEHFGAVYVSTQAMFEASNGSDQDLCALLGMRLSAADCQRKGWVVDGFPQNAPQLEYLRKALLAPTRVLCVTVDRQQSALRLQRRVRDRELGIVYPSEDLVTGDEVKARLVPASTPEEIDASYTEWEARSGELLAALGDTVVPLRGDDLPDLLRAKALAAAEQS